MSSRAKKMSDDVNKIKRENIERNQAIAIQQMKQLFDSPFNIRFKFCMKLLFRK